MKQKFWELKGEGEHRKWLFGAGAVALCVANIAMAAVNLSVELRPREAVRTDREGMSDLVLLPLSVTPSPKEAERFVRELALRLFSWDATTLASNREYVSDRVSRSVRGQLTSLVPGYSDSLKDSGTSGRVDMEVKTTRVLTQALPYQIEVQIAVEFTGRYTPPGLGEKDPKNPRRETYGYVFTVREVKRHAANPHGLEVYQLTPVAIAERS